MPNSGTNFKKAKHLFDYFSMALTDSFFFTLPFDLDVLDLILKRDHSYFHFKSIGVFVVVCPLELQN